MTPTYLDHLFIDAWHCGSSGVRFNWPTVRPQGGSHTSLQIRSLSRVAYNNAMGVGRAWCIRLFEGKDDARSRRDAIRSYSISDVWCLTREWIYSSKHQSD